MSLEQIILIAVLASLPLAAMLFKQSKVAATESVEQFSVGDRQFKMFRIGAGISMAFVGGAATLNMASLGYQYGWSVVLDPIVVFIALVIASVLAGKVRAGQGITLTDLLAGSSPKLRAILAITGLVVYQLLTASQFVALGKLLGPYFQEMPVGVVIAIPAVVVFAYTYLRGFQAVTNTDVLQLMIMLACYAVPCLWVFASSSTPPEGIIATSAPTAPFNLLIYLVLPLFFVPISHDTNLRVKAAESLFQARAGLMIGALQYVLFLFVSIGIGVFMRRTGSVVTSPESVLPLFFQQQLGSFSLVGTIAVMAAIVSTLDSMAFNTIVSASNDVLGPARAKGILSDKKALAISTIGILAIAMLIALVFQQILGLVLAALLLYVSVFIPVAVGRWMRTSDKSLIVTSLLTIAAIVGCKIAGYSPQLEPVAFLALHLVLVLILKGVVK